MVKRPVIVLSCSLQLEEGVKKTGKKPVNYAQNHILCVSNNFAIKLGRSIVTHIDTAEENQVPDTDILQF